MKTLDDASICAARSCRLFEMAELATTPEDRAAYLTFVVVGAGPTGVELVGQVAELAHTVLPRDYRLIDTREAIILLVEAAPTVLGPFAPPLQRCTQGVLEKMGVQVLCGTAAVAMDEDTITIKGPGGEDVIPARTRIWAAGVRASPLAKMLAKRTGADLDRAGRVSVLPDCTLPEHPEVFVIGDMASLVQGCGRLLWGPVHRPSRLPDVGVRPRPVPHRLGQPPRHPVRLASLLDSQRQPRLPRHHRAERPTRAVLKMPT
jgi:NADH:ubiquinone reductase (H+-translocating)